jgi:hypothetical protein
VISFTPRRISEMTNSFKFTSHDSLPLYDDLLTRVHHVTEQQCTSFHNSTTFPQDTCFAGDRASCSIWTTVTSDSTHRWSRWSRGWRAASGTQVRGFKPARSHRIFKGGKILSTPSFGREVKPWIPCRRFAACKRTLKCTVEVGILG